MSHNEFVVWISILIIATALLLILLNDHNDKNGGKSA